MWCFRNRGFFCTFHHYIRYTIELYHRTGRKPTSSIPRHHDHPLQWQRKSRRSNAENQPIPINIGTTVHTILHNTTVDFKRSSWQRREIPPANKCKRTERKHAFKVSRDKGYPFKLIKSRHWKCQQHNSVKTIDINTSGMKMVGVWECLLTRPKTYEQAVQIYLCQWLRRNFFLCRVFSTKSVQNLKSSWCSI